MSPVVRTVGHGSFRPVHRKDAARILAHRSQAGVQLSRSFLRTGTKIKEEAKKILDARKGRAMLGIADPNELRRIKYEDGRARLLADYRQRKCHLLKTLKNGKETVDGLQYLDRFFSGRSVVDIRRETLNQFVEQRQKHGASPGYINRNLALLRRMLKLLAEDAQLIVAKFPKLKEPPPRQGFCTPEQFAKLYKELPERLRPVALFIYTTGCRSGEAKKLEWPQVDWQSRLVRVIDDQTKNGMPRTIPLADEVYNRLCAVPEQQRVGLLFPVGCFRKAWKSACVRAGLGTLAKVKQNDGYGIYSGLRIHDFRRSAVRNLREEGISEGVAMSVSGHKTREVFERYNIVIDEDKTAAVAKVGAKLAKVLGKKARVPVPKNGSRMGQVRRRAEGRKRRIASVYAATGRSSNW